MNIGKKAANVGEKEIRSHTAILLRHRYKNSSGEPKGAILSLESLLTEFKPIYSLFIWVDKKNKPKNQSKEQVAL
jgi:hypothetical protein